MPMFFLLFLAVRLSSVLRSLAFPSPLLCKAHLSALPSPLPFSPPSRQIYSRSVAMETSRNYGDGSYSIASAVAKHNCIQWFMQINTVNWPSQTEKTLFCFFIPCILVRWVFSADVLFYFLFSWGNTYIKMMLKCSFHYRICAQTQMILLYTKRLF